MAHSSGTRARAFCRTAKAPRLSLRTNRRFCEFPPPITSASPDVSCSAREKTALSDDQLAEFVDAGAKALTLIANRLGPKLTQNWSRNNEAMQRAFLFAPTVWTKKETLKQTPPRMSPLAHPVSKAEQRPPARCGSCPPTKNAAASRGGTQFRRMQKSPASFRLSMYRENYPSHAKPHTLAIPLAILEVLRELSPHLSLRDYRGISLSITLAIGTRKLRTHLVKSSPGGDNIRVERLSNAARKRSATAGQRPERRQLRRAVGGIHFFHRAAE